MIKLLEIATTMIIFLLANKVEDYYGSDLITFSAIDADGNTSLNSNFQDVNANIHITVNPENDAPVLAPVSDISSGIGFPL